MKKHNSLKYMLMAAVASMTTTGCIEETFPEEGAATQEQVGASATALESSLRGIPTQMSQGYFVYGDQVHETDMSYAGLIIAQTEMLGDMSVHEGRISKIVSKLNRFLYIVCICLKALIAKIGILVTWYNYFAIIRQR